MDNEWPITFDHCECSHCSGASGPCAVCELLAELRWCDAERRLALRALAEYAPVCSWQGHSRERLATHEWDPAYGAGDGLYCDACSAPDKPCPPKPLRHAAQIAAADEEQGM